MGILINLFLTWWCWRIGSDALDDDHAFIGWLGIFLSAANFASALDSLTI